MDKQFFVISALKTDSSQLGHLKRHDTEKEAIEHAKSVIRRRKDEGQPTIGFYVLRVETYVGPVEEPIKVTKLKGRR